MNIQKNFLLATCFICCFFILPAQESIEKKSKYRFADKIIHSFGLQYNNAFHDKGKFTYRNAPNYSMGAHPCISYGREYIVKYNLTFPSGWGFSTEFVAGNRDFATWRINDETGKKVYMVSLWNESLKPFLEYTYFGGQLKATYMYLLNEKITVQPEMGIKLLKYIQSAWGYINVEMIADENGNPVVVDMFRWYDLSNDREYKRFMPEITAGINFLFHGKKDPRHNFVLGLNGTLGFIDRYSGWQRYSNTGKLDVIMKYGSSFFALNMGYEFTGFKKPLYKTKAYRKERIANMTFETFDFSKPVHSVGAYFTSGFGINTRVRDAQGTFKPYQLSTFVPELNLRYSLSVKSGLGFTFEIPVGLFERETSYSLHSIIPRDFVWASGKATGPGLSSEMHVALPYVGAVLKFSYLAPIHRNMFIQPEAGVKFMPFVYRLASFEALDGPTNIYYNDFKVGETDVVWLQVLPKVTVKSYVVPDITLAVNFMVHGKKPHHNFIFGVNANIGFVDRMTWEYQTTDALPSHLQSSGKYGLRSTYVGFHLGYQFMTASKRKYQ